MPKIWWLLLGVGLGVLLEVNDARPEFVAIGYKGVFIILGIALAWVILKVDVIPWAKSLDAKIKPAAPAPGEKGGGL